MERRKPYIMRPNLVVIKITAHNKAYPRRSEYLTWASPHCAKGRATSGKQDVIRNFAPLPALKFLA